MGYGAIELHKKDLESSAIEQIRPERAARPGAEVHAPAVNPVGQLHDELHAVGRELGGVVPKSRLESGAVKDLKFPSPFAPVVDDMLNARVPYTPADLERAGRSLAWLFARGIGRYPDSCGPTRKDLVEEGEPASSFDRSSLSGASQSGTTAVDGIRSARCRRTRRAAIA